MKKKMLAPLQILKIWQNFSFLTVFNISFAGSWREVSENFAILIFLHFCVAMDHIYIHKKIKSKFPWEMCFFKPWWQNSCELKGCKSLTPLQLRACQKRKKITYTPSAPSERICVLIVFQLSDIFVVQLMTIQSLIVFTF